MSAVRIPSTVHEDQPVSSSISPLPQLSSLRYAPTGSRPLEVRFFPQRVSQLFECDSKKCWNVANCLKRKQNEISSRSAVPEDFDVLKEFYSPQKHAQILFPSAVSDSQASEKHILNRNKPQKNISKIYLNSVRLTNSSIVLLNFEYSSPSNELWLIFLEWYPFPFENRKFSW